MANLAQEATYLQHLQPTYLQRLGRTKNQKKTTKPKTTNPKPNKNKEKTKTPEKTRKPRPPTT